MAGELGFEPRLTESESAVLPLNYSPLRAEEPGLIKIRKAYQRIGHGLRPLEPLSPCVAARVLRTQACAVSRIAGGLYLIIHDVPWEQFAFHETKPPRSPLEPI